MHVQAAWKPKGKGRRGGKENALLPVVAVYVQTLWRSWKMCILVKARWSFKRDIISISSTEPASESSPPRVFGHVLGVWGSLFLGKYFPFHRAPLFLSEGDLGGLRAQRLREGRGREQGQRGFTRKVWGFFFHENTTYNHVAGRREEAGIPAEEAGGHDQRSQICHKPGKFAGKSSWVQLMFN